MNEEQCMCYITYAIPKNMIPEMFRIMPAEPPKELYPSWFEPEWYRKSSFPEDDTED